MRTLIKLCVLASLLCLPALSHADSDDGKDCEGCSDSGLPARYPGSILLGADQKAFEEVALPVGPSVMTNGETSGPKTLSVTGKLTSLFYIEPAERSGLEVFTNYRETLVKSGMSVVWTCSGDQQCGPDFLDRATTVMQIELTNTQAAKDGLKLGTHPRYLLVKLARPQGDLHIAVVAADNWDTHRPNVYVIQIESKPMDKGMASTRLGEPVVEIKPVVTEIKPVKVEIKPAKVEIKPAVVEIKPVVIESKPAKVEIKPSLVESKPAVVASKPVDSATLKSNLASTGQVNVYGIHFDFDKADIKPESKEQLDEIAKLLTATPILKLRVTGHTDNKGTADHNQALSKRRADAIVAALVANYAIAANRLTASGLGASMPVASNDTDQGRALNRRVELVKQ
jgi:OOP family OmpA-OmpF porin